MEAAAPPPRAASAAARLARLFEVYLVLNAGLTVVFLVLVWDVVDARGRLLVGSMLVLFGVLGILIRLGWTWLAAGAYLAGLWLAVTLGLLIFDAFHGPLVCAYMLVALGASFLFGTRGALVSTAVIVASSVAITVAELRGWLPDRVAAYQASFPL